MAGNLERIKRRNKRRVREKRRNMNINDNVLVELTARGKKILYDTRREAAPYYCKWDNTYKFQFWELMEIYGRYITGDQVFAANAFYVKRSNTCPKCGKKYPLYQTNTVFEVEKD